MGALGEQKARELWGAAKTDYGSWLYRLSERWADGEEEFVKLADKFPGAVGLDQDAICGLRKSYGFEGQGWAPISAHHFCVAVLGAPSE